MKNSKPKKGSMLDRWRMDEEMYPSNPLGMEKQDGPFTLYYDDGQKRLEGICDDGKPIMYPYVRCKLTDEIINAKRNDTEVDHADGDRRNNTIENFTFVIKHANAAKAECTSYEEVDKKLSKIIATIRKYK